VGPRGGRYSWADIQEGCRFEVLESFASRAEFVTWRAQQSDWTLEHWKGSDDTDVWS
jgi:hypothetical protein